LRKISTFLIINSKLKKQKMKRESPIVNLDQKPRLTDFNPTVRFDSVVKNEKGGRIPFGTIVKKMVHHFAPKQIAEGIIGRLLISTIPEELFLMNSAFLDWLMRHQKYIPADWKKKITYFPGTVFMKEGVEVIRGLYHGMNGWATTYRWIDRGFQLDSPLAVMTKI
jgi:hypothetical protein